MITRKSKIASTTAVWPYTPEPSPPLGATTVISPVDEHFTMAEEPAALRPISVVSKRDTTMFSSSRPTLDDVLNSRAPSPYTLAAYTAFLSQQHCLETLEFVTEAKKYSSKYYEAAANLAGMPLNTDSDEGSELMQDWCRLLDIYVKPGAPREINLPAEERDDLVEMPYSPRPPIPEALDPAVQRMYDLMSDSIFIPFCNSLKTASSAPAHSAGSGYSHHAESMEYSQPGANRYARRRRSPPTTSPSAQRSAPTSALTSGLTRTSSARLSMHVSHSSAASEAAMSDASSNSYGHAPADLDTLTSPPLTPPQSDMPSTFSSHNVSVSAGTKPIRSDSGGWKKLGNRIFGGNKKRGTRD